MFLDSYMRYSGDGEVGPRGWLVGGVSVLGIINGWAAIHVLIMRRRDVCGCPLPGSHGRGLDAPHVDSSNCIQPRTPHPPAARNRTKRGRAGHHTRRDDRVRRHVRGRIRKHVPRRWSAAGLYLLCWVGSAGPTLPNRKKKKPRKIHT